MYMHTYTYLTNFSNVLTTVATCLMLPAQVMYFISYLTGT